MSVAAQHLRIPGIVSLVFLSGGLALSQDTPPPSLAEQQKILDAMRAYAADYVSHLPNFICQQLTRQFESGKKPDHWRKGDTFASRLIFSQGREERRLELVNDKPVAFTNRAVRRPLTTEGEFGVLLANVFKDDSAATFSWRGWELLRGRRVAGFNFDIDKEHSTVRLSLNDLAHATVPYRGSVFADPTTGQVFRISDSAYDIPAEVRTKSLTRTIDYEPVAIAGREYLLPVEASILLDTGSRNVLNRLEFRGYRKFEADSSITFDSEPQPTQKQAPTPLPPPDRH